MSGEGLYTGGACAESAESEPVSASVHQISGAVTEWVDQVGRFLGVLQVALEQSRPRDDAPADVRALSGQLPALIRQCRAQVPTPDMIHTWVQTLAGARGPEGDHDPAPVMEARAIEPRAIEGRAIEAPALAARCDA